MPYVLAMRNQTAGKCHPLARADESQEKEEHIVDFLCGLLRAILLWVRNRLGPRNTPRGRPTATSCERLDTRSSGRVRMLTSRLSSTVSGRP